MLTGDVGGAPNSPPSVSCTWIFHFFNRVTIFLPSYSCLVIPTYQHWEDMYYNENEGQGWKIHGQKRQPSPPYQLLCRAQPVIPPNLYSNVYEHNSLLPGCLGSPGKLLSNTMIKKCMIAKPIAMILLVSCRNPHCDVLLVTTFTEVGVLLLPLYTSRGKTAR